jgi:hypothetical protein
VFLKNTLTILVALVLVAGSAVAEPTEEPAFGALTGNVSSSVTPLALSKVYAYHLSGQQLTKVSTDQGGNFQFERLPAGLYKIIAFKDGFVPGIALLSRATSEAFQYLKLELYQQEIEQPGAEEDFWAVRERIPGDVLRDIQIEIEAQDEYASSGIQSTVVNPDQIDAEMSAIAGVENNPELGNASVAGGRVDIEGAVSALNVGLTGDYRTLQPTPGGDTANDLSSTGRSQNVSLQVLTKGASGVRVSTSNSYLSTADPGDLEDDLYVGLARHRVSWSQNLGRHGRSDLSVDYAEENNFFNQTAMTPFWVPDASRTWRVEGSYSTAINRTSNLRTGFQFRERQFDINNSQISTLDYDPMQRVDLFGNSGVQVKPGILVEVGLYSTLADGSLALAPSGGLALKLGQNWRAEASGSWRVHEDRRDTLYEDFTPAMFGEYESCQALEQYCYKVTLAHKGKDQDDLTVGIVNRRFAETLHLYFNDDFFSRIESIYLVRGDELPEIQVEATRRLSPRILARLSSNIAAGGGGILYAADENSYENEVRYLVTSLDTRFQQTETGIFMAFHHVGQKLTPMGQTVKTVPEMELERLQLMLTQDLGILSQVASAWAVHLNMEVSRGNTPDESDDMLVYDNEELRKRVMGGVSFSF